MFPFRPQRLGGNSLNFTHPLSPAQLGRSVISCTGLRAPMLRLQRVPANRHRVLAQFHFREHRPPQCKLGTRGCAHTRRALATDPEILQLGSYGKLRRAPHGCRNVRIDGVRDLLNGGVLPQQGKHAADLGQALIAVVPVGKDH